MNHEWPLLGREVEAAEPLLPLPLEEHVAVIKSSPAIDAFARKRSVQVVTHGHTAEADLQHSIGTLAMEAKARLNALTEIVGGYQGRMDLPPGRREQCMRYVEISGALLIALWERCQAEPQE